MSHGAKSEEKAGSVSVSPCLRVSPSSPSQARAWLYLVWLSWQRLGRFRLMLWIALAILGFSTFLVAVQTRIRGWDSAYRRSPETGRATFDQWGLFAAALPGGSSQLAVQDAVSSAYRAALRTNADLKLINFTGDIVFSLFVTFLLPILSLSFATEALGGEREARSITWLLSRPLSRSAIYLAKFLAIVPWTLGLNLAAFGLICLAGGQAGRTAFHLYWPAVAWSSLAFAALFHLMGMYFRWPAVIAIAYTFFLESFVGNMPGSMKRVSISFYTRSMMFDVAEKFGVRPEKPSIYLPVGGTTALYVLLGTTVALLLAGMIVFSRQEYREAT